MRLCSSCGTEVNDQAAFCSNCGAALAQVKVPIEAPVTETLEAPVTETLEAPVAESLEAPVAETLEAPVAETFETPVAETFETPVIPTDAKICTNCGNPCNKNAVICVKCGQSLTASAPASSDTIFCTNCGNSCNKNAVICVKCGQTLTSSNSKATTKAKTNVDLAKVISILSIVLCAIGVLSVTISTISSFSYSWYNPVPSLISIAGSVFVLVGFIKGKCNKLPGIGYILSVLSSIVSLIVYENDITFVLILSIIQTLMMAALFIGKNEIRKFWYAPIAVYGLIVIIGFISNISYGNFGYAISGAATMLGGVFGAAVSCLNAKLNWNNPNEN